MRQRSALAASAVVLALLVAGCTAPATSADAADVPFRGCDEIACTGTLDGARYEILLPTTWNGTLLLYSHGYRAASPVPPDFEPVPTSAEPAPGWSDGEKEVAEALLAEGYALAGSSFASNGWAVQDGVKAGEDLYAFFAENVGAPARVYAWGDSLGGLITAELAEKHPDWVSGAAPLCAPLAGLVPNMDLALDVAYAVRELIWKDFQITGYTSYEQAITAFQGAVERVLDAAGDVEGGGTAKVLFVAALVDAPLQTRTYDGSTVPSQVKAAVEGIVTALGYGTYARYDIERRVGGNPSTNVGTKYSQRFTVADQRRIDQLRAGATRDYAAALAEGARIQADPAARSRALEHGDPSGSLGVPMVTLHTAADPLVLVQNQSWYRDRAEAAGAGATLVQAVTIAPASYPETTGAPSGAGHCAFTPESRVGLVRILDGWVRGGQFPGAVSMIEALGEDSGFSPTAVPGPWPLGGVQPLD